MNNSTAQFTLPKNSAWFTRMFAAYSEWLLKRNFHSVRVLGEPNLDQFEGRPVVIYANHPSWWDPIVGLVLWRRLLRNRISYAPIDASMLKKYGFFKRLGYFGVDKRSISGVRQFLKTGVSLLRRADTLLFFTPQGRFADVRETRPEFEAGLSHLAARSTEAVFIPMAVEFTYWEEKRPEILVRFGEALEPAGERSPRELNTILEARLAQATERLAAASIAREADAFQNLLQGNVGTNIVYDAWRRLKSVFKRQKFTPAHGTK
jgi:1-acyl-sn-glycerol-3-phosphate acyltransferase